MGTVFKQVLSQGLQPVHTEITCVRGIKALPHVGVSLMSMEALVQLHCRANVCSQGLMSLMELRRLVSNNTMAVFTESIQCVWYMVGVVYSICSARLALPQAAFESFLTLPTWRFLSC
jgi:hypothetical protein